MGRRGYPPEFRRKVLDLLEAGRKVADVARDMTAEWERTDDGSNWRHWMDMSFVRASSPSAVRAGERLSAETDRPGSTA
ncbi:hypothetical protein GCM10010402_34890 [Actinomadura luteofluorescens]|uniref:hypothetical protein n=1 Tax=Actinomadura luteofluorescens TaxID=46163 RepID=UPI00216433CA|nr:hypothetical protein [Actinomadura glauciflava]MCR3746023.1 hypothetical protein [Actinomadura glauciflava]